MITTRSIAGIALLTSLASPGIAAKAPAQPGNHASAATANATSCPVALDDVDTELTPLERIEACAMQLASLRRVPESLSMAEKGLALALRQSGEKSEDYAYALNTHAVCLGLTGNAALAAKEMQRAEQISAALEQN